MKIPKGVVGHVFNDVFFTEQAIPKAQTIRRLSVRIRHQNSTLDDVKKRLAEQAKSAGADAIMNFRYGQKLMSMFQALIRFQWEIEFWHGEGDAIKM